MLHRIFFTTILLGFAISADVHAGQFGYGSFIYNQEEFVTPRSSCPGWIKALGGGPFKVPSSIPWIKKPLVWASLYGLNRIFHDVEGLKTNDNVFHRIIQTMKITRVLRRDTRSLVPREGPVCFLANHPNGWGDGFMLMDLALSIRPDVKIILADFFKQVPSFKDFIIPVDIFSPRSEEVVSQNRKEMLGALRWIRTQGHAMAVHPAGGISRRWPDGRYEDKDWDTRIGQILRVTKPTVVPVYIEGQSDYLFQRIGQVSRGVRMLLHPRQVTRMRGRTYEIWMGDPIAPEGYKSLLDAKDDTGLIQHFRTLTYELPRSSD